MRNLERFAATVVLALAAAAGAHAEVIRQDIGPMRLRGLHPPLGGPKRLALVHFPRAGWLHGLSVHLIDARGQSADERAVFCHAVVRVLSRETARLTLEPLHVTLSEGANEMSFPEGYGMFVDSSTKAEIEVQLQNADPANEGVYTFRIAYDFAPLGQALKTLAGFSVLAGPEPVWRLPQGKSRQDAEFTMPYSGTIHYLSPHIHQYARTLSLLDRKTGKALASLSVRNRPDGWPALTPVYSSAEGIPVVRGQRLVFRIESDNTSPKPVSVMALMRVYVHRTDAP